jgi:LruC domain-containing protein
MKKGLVVGLCLFMASACVEEPAGLIDENLVHVETGFDFKTAHVTSLDFYFESTDGQPIRGVPIEIWDKLESDGGKVLFKALTNNQGRISHELNLPDYLEKVVLEANYIGIPNSLWLPINNRSINLTYQGSVDESQLASNGVANDGNFKSTAANGNFDRLSSENGLSFNYMGSYSSNGVPDYLEPNRDVISSQLLEYINASLPEKQPVPDYHPTFLASGKKTTLEIVETCDVWVTFVHEGAGFRNAIGFYTYDTDTPPQSVNDISTVNVIFPNLSYAGSGGGLYSGDKVSLGRYEAGTSIGLVLMANGWDGTSSEDYYHIVYGDKTLNPEATDELKQHNVVLWDEENELFLIGFEDILRDHRPFRCDNDFNDAILFVTSNPVEAISTENVNPVDKPGTLDTDGDGINDIFDEYPDDPDKAYDSYYPSSTTYGTFSFEDNWPDYGDYDFNDLVIDYQFKHILNADNRVTRMEPSFKIRAIGAGYRNGFGFSTGMNPSDVTSVTGSSLHSGYITNNANGTEAGQTNAVFIVTDNVHDHFSTGGFVNTQEEDNYFEPQTVTLGIDLVSPKTYAEIGAVPYNPFLIISRDRGREVHLPGYEPTDKVDTEYFGTLDDNSDPSQGIYYRSKTDLPWAIHLPESFDYPKEKADVRQGHLRFTDWARSSGFSYMDWYRGQTGYRNTNHIYRK